MLELLRDPLWQFVGAVLAVLTIAVSFIIYQLQRTKRGVTYDVISRTNLLTVREELEGKLQVLYEGEPARSLTILILKIWNSGNQPILSVDFDRPISFCTGKSSKLLTADVTDTEPRGLIAELEISNHTLVLKPTLLNPGDTITLKILVRDASPTLCPDARIVGIKSIRRAGEGSKLFSIVATTGMALLAIGLYLFISNSPKTENIPPLPPSSLMGGIIALFGYLLVVYALVRIKRFRLSLARFAIKRF